MKKLVRTLAATFALSLTALALPATADHVAADHEKMEVLSQTGPTGYTNSDLAFWGNMAAQGYYNGFRLFNISNPASPVLISNVTCPGNQADPTLFDRDADGVADILFLSVDQVMEGPDCGDPPASDPEDPSGWEGIRIFDITNPAAPTQIGTVYQDCGSHTHTLWPDLGNQRVLLWNSSYSLRAGPTCGPTAGPANGRDALHGVIQIVQVGWSKSNPLGPVTAGEIAEPPITYFGDPDNKFDPQEHGLPEEAPPGNPLNDLRACHDIGVFVGRGIAGGACAEQAQLWRVNANGIPDTANPIWVYDDNVDETGTTGNPNDTGVVVDFWHSATFSWDGSVVNFIDESFDSASSSNGACPPTTDAPIGGDSGRMFFLDTKTGTKLSHFMIPRPEAGAYCTSHLGIPVPTKNGRNLLVNAWYQGGINVVDFTDPKNPKEIAFWDYDPDGPSGSDDWAAYWYEGPRGPGGGLTIYATDGFGTASTARGFLSVRADVNVPEYRFSHLNPQTQGLICKGKAGTIFGTPAADVIKGTPADDVIVGGDGKDRILGLKGRDLICGGRGKDKISGGGGKDKILGEEGKDNLRGGGGKDKLVGGPGNDRCHGGPGKDKARQCTKELQV